MSKRLPHGFRRQADDSIVCAHRDVSCCKACLAATPEMVDCLGAVYFVPDAAERAEMVAMVARSNARRA